MAAALQRRLPRRMAARFLPDLEGVIAAAAGTSQLPVDAAGAAAAEVMAALLLVGLSFDCLLALSVLFEMCPGHIHAPMASK